MADLRKFLSSNHNYNSHIAFWHDFGDNRKNIFYLCFLPRRTQRKCQKIFINLSTNYENVLDKNNLVWYNVDTIESLYGQKRNPTTGMLIAAEFFVKKFYFE